MSFGKSDLQAHADRVLRDDTIVNKTATATLTELETYVVVTPAAATTITLPPAGTCKNGHRIAIYVVDATTYNVTINALYEVNGTTANDNVGGFTAIVIDQNKVLLVFDNVASRDWILVNAKNDGVSLPTLADIAV
jgi:hypothetical protein